MPEVSSLNVRSLASLACGRGDGAGVGELGGGGESGYHYPNIKIIHDKGHNCGGGGGWGVSVAITIPILRLFTTKVTIAVGWVGGGGGGGESEVSFFVTRGQY